VSKIPKDTLSRTNNYLSGNFSDQDYLPPSTSLGHIQQCVMFPQDQVIILEGVALTRHGQTDRVIPIVPG